MHPFTIKSLLGLPDDGPRSTSPTSTIQLSDDDSRAPSPMGTIILSSDDEEVRETLKLLNDTIYCSSFEQIHEEQQRGTGRKRHHSHEPQDSDDEPRTSRQRLEDDDAPFMRILKEKTGESESRNTRHIDFTVCFAATEQTATDPERQMTEAFTKLYESAFAGRDPPTGILIQVFPPNWVKEFTIPLRPLEQNSPDVVAEAMMKVNEEYGGGLDLFDGASEVRIIAVWPLDRNRGAV